MAEQPRAARIARPALIGAGIAAVLTFALLLLALSRDSRAVAAFDSAVGAVVRGMRADGLTPWVVRATDLGSADVAIPLAVVAVVIALVARKWAAAVLIAATLGLGYALNSGVQELVRRTRPPQGGALIPLPTTFSFPSGHTVTSLLIYGVLALLLWRALPYLWARVAAVGGLTLIIVTVGLSRVYLGVHWPTDVVGAWLLGGAWLALLGGAYVSWERYRASREAVSRV